MIKYVNLHVHGSRKDQENKLHNKHMKVTSHIGSSGDCEWVKRNDEKSFEIIHKDFLQNIYILFLLLNYMQDF